MNLLLMLGAILLFLLLCGMYATASAVSRSAEKLRSHRQHGKSAQATSHLVMGIQDSRSDWQTRLQEVKELFALYQSGALTREEFEQAKSHLLAELGPQLKRN